jgi:hypothetical protein
MFNGKYKLAPFFTNLSISNTRCFFCCGGKKEEHNINKMYLGKKSRNEILNIIELENSYNVNSIRCLAYFIHWVGVFMILQPVSIITGIPYFGYVSITKVVIISFVVGLACFLIIASISWLFVRTYSAVMVIGTVILLCVTTKIILNNLNPNFDIQHKTARLVNRIILEESNFLDY